MATKRTFTQFIKSLGEIFNDEDHDRQSHTVENSDNDQTLETTSLNIEERRLFDNLVILWQSGNYDDVISNIRSLPIERSKQLIHSDDEYFFTAAAQRGRIDFIDLLLDLTTDVETKENMIHAQQDLPFYQAVTYNKVEVIKRLVNLTPDSEKLQEMLIQNNNYPFYKAAEYGSVELLKYYLDLIPDAKKDEVIHANNDRAFRTAVNSGNIQAVKLLVINTPDQNKLNTMLHSLNDVSFFDAAVKGYNNIMIYLIELVKLHSPETLHKMIHRGNSEAPFIIASKYHQKESVKLLEDLTKNDDQEIYNMFHAKDDQAFKLAILETNSDKEKDIQGNLNQETLLEIVRIFFDYDFKHFVKIYNTQVLPNLFSSDIKECINDEIIKYSTLGDSI